MPAVSAKPVGSPIWIELSTTDGNESARFYEKLFGLTAADTAPEMGGYRNLMLDGNMIAGLMQPPGDLPSAWTVYLLTDDINATLERIVPNGGTVLMLAQDVTDLGWFAFAQDPSGAYFGLWQQGLHKGSELENEPGTPCWYELHVAHHFRETVEFYEKLFDQKASAMSDSDEFRMFTFGEGDDARSGVYELNSTNTPDWAADQSSHWVVYFTTDDADAAVETIRAEGGEVISGPADTPYGRMVSAKDSTGAGFSLMELPTPSTDGSA